MSIIDVSVTVAAEEGKKRQLSVPVDESTSNVPDNLMKAAVFQPDDYI